MNKKILFFILTVIAGLVLWNVYARMVDKGEEVIKEVRVEDNSLQGNAPSEMDEDAVPDEVPEEDKE